MTAKKTTKPVAKKTTEAKPVTKPAASKVTAKAAPVAKKVVTTTAAVYRPTPGAKVSKTAVALAKKFLMRNAPIEWEALGEKNLQPFVEGALADHLAFDLNGTQREIDTTVRYTKGYLRGYLSNK